LERFANIIFLICTVGANEEPRQTY